MNDIVLQHGPHRINNNNNQVISSISGSEVEHKHNSSRLIFSGMVANSSNKTMYGAWAIILNLPSTILGLPISSSRDLHSVLLLTKPLPQEGGIRTQLSTRKLNSDLLLLSIWLGQLISQLHGTRLEQLLETFRILLLGLSQQVRLSSAPLQQLLVRHNSDQPQQGSPLQLVHLTFRLQISPLTLKAALPHFNSNRWCKFNSTLIKCLGSWFRIWRYQIRWFKPQLE